VIKGGGPRVVVMLQGNVVAVVGEAAGGRGHNYHSLTAATRREEEECRCKMGFVHFPLLLVLK